MCLRLNFGPATDAELSVRELSHKLQSRWDNIHVNFASEDGAPHEAHRLKLDSRKAREQLNWRPVWDCSTTIDRTVDWYRSHYEEVGLEPKTTSMPTKASCLNFLCHDRNESAADCWCCNR